MSAPSDEEVEAHVRMCWGVECSSELVEVVVRFLDDFNVIDRMYADTADRPKATYEVQPDGSVTVSYTHLDVYKRQAAATRLAKPGA